MRGSRARLFVMATALMVLATACSSFSGKPSVSVKGVPVDLAFGGKPQTPPRPSPTPTPATPGSPSRPTLPPGAVLPPPVEEAPPAPAEICQPENPFPKEPAPPDITEQPTIGSYPFAYERTVGKKVTKDTGFRRITDVALEAIGLQTVGFAYTVVDDFTGQRATFVVRTDETTKGFYLRAIGLPQGDGELLVQPQPMVQILFFPLQPRTTQTARGVDPLTGTVMTSEATVLDRVPEKDRVRACDGVADAWRVHWVLELTGPTPQKWDGTFWFATQWGGWPIADSVSMSGSLLSGTFDSTIRGLEPKKATE